MTRRMIVRSGLSVELPGSRKALGGCGGYVGVSASLKRYWMSWIEGVDGDGDYRPLTIPDRALVPAWWASGLDSDDDPILCAVVDATSPDEAEQIIEDHWCSVWHWFCKQKPLNWRPQADRFPWPGDE